MKIDHVFDNAPSFKSFDDADGRFICTDSYGDDVFYIWCDAKDTNKFYYAVDSIGSQDTLSAFLINGNELYWIHQTSVKWTEWHSSSREEDTTSEYIEKLIRIRADYEVEKQIFGV